MRILNNMIHKKSDLQIAPLIDVVFLLLIYFMVTASLIKKEADLSFALPAGTTSTLGIPIEVLIEVTEPGDIMIEGMRFQDMNVLIGRLTLLKESADLSSSDLIVNILPADKALHGRIVAVMDACAAADVDDMSFCL
jgi:biopolymer transport protein ExbD